MVEKCEGGAGHVQGQQHSCEMCSRRHRWVKMEIHQPLHVSTGDGQDDRDRCNREAARSRIWKVDKFNRELGVDHSKQHAAHTR